MAESNSVQEYMKEHIRRYIASNGEDGHHEGGNTCLVLTTTGRQSGQPRQVAIIYVPCDKGYAVVASKGGSDTPPAWYLNLQANNLATIQVGADVMEVNARISEGDERETLWATLVEAWPTYADYQKKTERQLGIVVLEPIAE